MSGDAPGAAGPVPARSSTVPDAFVATVASLTAVAAGLTAQGGGGRTVEVLVAGAAIAAAYALPRRLGWAAGVLAFAAYVGIEAAGGRLDRGHYWVHVFYASGILAGVLGAGYLRTTRSAPEPDVVAAIGLVQPPPADADPLEALLAGRQDRSSLDVELERARRHNHQASLMHVRPDDVNDVRDRHGPEGVQAALRYVAEAIGEHLRVTDVPLRAGAVDFWVILPETPPEGARVVAERIRLDVSARSLEFGPGDRVNASVSIGIASFPADAASNDELVAAAATSLERALELGGNRTVLHTVPTGGPRGWGLERDAVETG